MVFILELPPPTHPIVVVTCPRLHLTTYGRSVGFSPFHPSPSPSPLRAGRRAGRESARIFKEGRKPGPHRKGGLGCQVVDAKGTEEKMTQWAGPRSLGWSPDRPKAHSPDPSTLFYILDAKVKDRIEHPWGSAVIADAQCRLWSA